MKTRTFASSRHVTGSVIVWLLAVPLLAGVNRWTSQGPYLGQVAPIAFSPSNPSTVYTASITGVFRSDDGGSTWRPIDRTLQSLYGRVSVGSLASDPVNSAILYLGTYGAGVYKTTDGGASWMATDLPSSYYARFVSGLAVDPANSNVVYASTYDGVLKSVDAGCTWTPMNVGLPESNGSFYTETIALDPTDSSVIYLGTFSLGVYRSADGAATWAQVSIGLPYPSVESIAIDPSVPSRLFAVDNLYFGDVGGGTGAIMESQDSGQSWQASGTGLPTTIFGAVLVDPASPATLWASAPGQGIFRSTDDGATWAPSSSGLDELTVYGLAFLPGTPRLLAAEGFSGMAHSDDLGSSWQSSRDGLRAAQWLELAVAPSSTNVIFAGANGNEGGLAKSVDGGQSWQSSGDGLVTDAVILGLAIDPTDASVVYASQFATAPATFKSTDGGASWNPAANGLGLDTPRVLAIDPSDHLHVFGGGYQNFYHSSDGGASWTPSTTALFVQAIVPAGGGLVYALGYDPVQKSDYPYVSTDGGDTWTEENAGLPGVYCLAGDPSNPSVLYAGTAGAGLFRSADGGVTWSAVGDLSAYTISAVVVDPSDATDLFIGTTSFAGVLRSRDSGATWAPLVTGLDQPGALQVLTLTLAPGGPHLYAGTEVGVFDNLLSDAAGPVPASLSPASGPTAGGTSVAISGSGFVTGAQVSIGGSPATSVIVVDAVTITLATPPGVSGAADVTVQNPDGQLETIVRGFVFDFDDVPPTATYHDDVARLTRAGATAGCAPGLFCPDEPITRADMAVLIERSIHGPDFSYPPPTVSFSDVLLCSPAGKYILQMASEALTAGCGFGDFCPGAGNTRAQAAVFVLKAEHGSGYAPPPATGTVFADVPADAFAADFIEQLASEGVTVGCGGGLFCPNASATRAQAAVWLSRTVLAP